MSNHRSRLHRPLLTVLVVAGTYVGAGMATAQPEYTPEVKASALILPSVVYLESGAGPDSRLPLCTGFIVTPDGYIGTAGHCVESAEGSEIYVSAAGQSGEVFTTLARVIDYRPVEEGDVALLKVEAAHDDLPTAQLAEAADLEVGTEILSVGYPASTEALTDRNIDPTVKSGTVSAEESVATQTIYEVSAPMSAGMSGGPTVNLDGEVVGINSRAPAGETQPFNFIVPVDSLVELLAAQGVTAESSPADDAYREGLTNYYSGNYGDAVDNFETAVNQSQSYPQAIEMRRESLKMREQYGDGGSATIQPWVWVVAGLVTAGIVAAAVVFFIRSRQGSGGRAPAGGSGTAQAQQNVAAPQAMAPSDRAPGASGPSGSVSTCTNCGFGLEAGQTFCPRCGVRQS